MKEGFIMHNLRRVERVLYDGAERIVTVTEPMRMRLIERGVPAEKVGVVPNGADLERLIPRIRNARLTARLHLEGKFVVAYVGTLGLAQGLEVVIRAAAIVANSDVHFLFVGEGAKRADLIELSKSLGVTNVSFVGAVPSDAAIDYLALADAIVVSLKKSTVFDGALPSKIFEAAAMERPILLSARGISAELVHSYHAGLVVEPENPEALAAAVLQLRTDAQLRESFRAGCRRLACQHDRERMAGLMLAEIRHAAGLVATVS
jgi:glycosyltransferase involved in cell wall biosynthesis